MGFLTIPAGIAGIAGGGGLSVAAGVKAPLGSAGMNQVISSSFDDSFTQINSPFAFFMGGSSYTEIFPGSNSYITFGSGASAYSGLSLASQPGQPSIHLGSADNSYQQVFWVAGPGNKFLWIRFEGAAGTSGTPGSPSIVWEATFINPSLSPGKQYFEIVVGVHGQTGGLFGVGGSGITPVSGGTIQPNQSYVFSSNPTGTTWAIEPGKYLVL